MKIYRRRRIRLFNVSPFCHWCGCALVLVDQHIGHPPDNAATIDHLRSRLHPARREPNHAMEERTVLACRKCNQRRSTQENDALSREEQRRRSGSYPRGFNPPHIAEQSAASPWPGAPS